jgi:outer membrane immunogenic protein
VFKRLIVLTAVLATGSTAAIAADLTTPYVAPSSYSVSGFDWSGFYVGVAGGYGTSHFTATSVATGVVNSADHGGGMLGVTVGANTQFDQFVLGVEGDVLWSGMGGSGACSAAPAFSCSSSVDWQGTLRARAGFAVDSVLLFATGGLAFGGVSASTNGAAAPATGSYSGTGVGFTVGGGIELAVTEQVSLKAEYAYTDLGTLRAPAGTLANTSAVDLRATNHTFKIGANFHF